MATATPLSLPLILHQNEQCASSSPRSFRRRWKPDRPNYRALLTTPDVRTAADGTSTLTSSRLPNGAKQSVSQLDTDQLEADLQQWGLPSAPASASAPVTRLAVPTAAISWDENSTHHSCSLFQTWCTTASTSSASLDQWDPSISFTPCTCSGLDPVKRETGSGGSDSALRYDPSLGRIVAVGRQDGTVTIYRAYGRDEDYDSFSSLQQQTDEVAHLLAASASASSNLSRASVSASRRSSIVSNPSRLRSPDLETPPIRLPYSNMSRSTSSSSREPSSLFSTFSQLDHSSRAARSTMSAASVSSVVAANVQLDEGLPAGSIQSNVTATGHTAGRTYSDQAENRLELQIAAAERNDHQHGVMGGVIERLGLSSHSTPSLVHHSSASQQHLRQSYHRTRSSTSRYSPSGSSTLNFESQSPSSTQLQQSSTGSDSAKPVDTQLPSTPSASDAWLRDPGRGSFSKIMTLLTRDRSAVVALRLVPLSARANNNPDADAAPVPVPVPAQPTPEKVALLVVQEAGNISLWSLLEGTMLWQTDLTVAQAAPVSADSTDSAAKEAPASPLGVMHSLSRQLPAAIGTPLTRSPAGSARASPRPTLTAGDASIRRSMLRSALSAPDATAKSRLREAHGVEIACSAQVFQCHGSSLALVWDSHAFSLFILDLADGLLLLHERIDDVHTANVPTLRSAFGSQGRLELVWFSQTEGKLQVQPLRVLTTQSADSHNASTWSGKVQGIFFDEVTTDADHIGSKRWSLGADHGEVNQLLFSVNRVLVLSPNWLSVLNFADGQTLLKYQATTDPFSRLSGSSRDAHQFLIQTATGLSKLDLATRRVSRVKQSSAEPDPDKPSLSEPVAHPSARLRLSWNLPLTGAILDKVFLLQPLSIEETRSAPIVPPSPTQIELAAFDLTHSRVEDLLAFPRSKSDPEPAEVEQESADKCERITALLPLSLERIAMASSGGLRILSLSSIAAGRSSFPAKHARGPADGVANSLGADHDICLLRSAVIPRSGHRLIIGGTLQGEVGFWTAPTTSGTSQGGDTAAMPQLEAALSVSTTPVEALVVFGDDDNTIRMHGCVACICADSSVTVVLLDGFRQLYTVPGRGARLTSLAVRADELLLSYDDGKARVWDLRSQELRRSIATDQAQALIEDGKGWWTVKTIEPYSPLHSGTTGVLSQLAAAREATAASLLVDFRRAIEAATRSVRGGGGTAQSFAHETASAQTAARGGTSSAGSLPPPATRYEQEPDRGNGPALVGLGSPAARKAVNIVRPLLPTVFPVGLDASMDAKLTALLDLDEPTASWSLQKRARAHTSVSIGLHSAPDGLMVGAVDADAKQAWKLSSRLTTTRLLIASALLRVLSHVDELNSLADELQRFVQDQAKLSSLVGIGFRDVTLTELVPYWLDSNEALQNACRMIFQAALSRLDQSQLDELCNQWQGLLVPAARSTWQLSSTRTDARTTVNAGASGGNEAELRTRALTLLGSIAVERYTCLSPKLLKDIASTIHDAIVSDNGGEMRTVQELQTLAVAIELCRSGFSMWQHYFDATEVVRSLFALSTSIAGSGSSAAEGELRSLARTATLQIAAENTPLFMTTLSLDILHARSAGHCAATMRLVAFMVRKRPSVLVANLPRLAEAVVKSLDPTYTTMREAVVNAATVMITELVSTYPSVSFFGIGQRLAVGTHEGAVIMYDLKTATRLYVLEGHRRRTDAVSFSPDGRRLVTMSLEEGRVLVWKTWSGFSSFFTPGQMPRQGATDARLTDGAYKAFLFNVGDQQHTTSRSSSVIDPTTESAAHGDNGHEQEFVGFDRIGFHWNSERSVKVQIGQAQLNISVD